MKPHPFLRNSILTALCVGGLFVFTGCCHYCGHGDGKKFKEPRSAAVKSAPGDRAERLIGRPEAGQPGMGMRMGMGPGRGMGQGMGRGMGMGPGMGGGMGMGMPEGRGHIAARQLLAPPVVKELGLTDDQVERIRKIDQTAAAQVRPIQERRREGQAKMRELMQAPQPDKTAIMKQIDIDGQTQIDLRKAQVSEMLELRGVLTPEQFDKARGLIRQRMEGAGPGARRPGSPADRPLRAQQQRRDRVHQPADAPAVQTK